MRGALVAGTNGKGSVLALAGAALQAAGYTVGSTPKPHLVTYRERIQVNGRPIAAADFARLVGDVLGVADRVARRHGEPTEFELLTAVVFARFAEVRPDVALVEVGLGGRLDATHAWDGGVAAVTNVDLDHMDRLGDTVTAIAREKAAIIERGDLAVTGARGDGLAVIRRRARRLAVPLTEVPPASIVGWDRDGIDVDLPRLGRTRVGLRGRHQAANVAIADAMLDALEAAGIVATDDVARRTGYANAVWPGRLELLRVADRDVLLDGAHNPAGAAALATALDDLRPFLSDGPIQLVTASMADKDVDGVIAALAAASAIGRRDGHLHEPGPHSGLAGRRPRGAVAVRVRRRLAAGWFDRRRTGPDGRPRPGVGGTWTGRRGRFALSCRCCARSLDRRPRPARPGPDRGPMTDPALTNPSPGAVPTGPAPSRIGPATFRWGERTYVMGILNVTPDSFSGDGLLGARPDGVDPDAAVDTAVAMGRRMVAEGADLLDVGGESTRPGHVPVTLEEERRRVVPVIAAVRAALPDIPISVDTTKPAVAEAALAAGADMVNHIWGVGDDEALPRIAADHGVPLIVMHNRAEARYTTFLPEVIADLQAALERALRLGVRWDDLLIDPGFGFGKTPEQNLAIVRDLGALRMLGRPILLGTSRKSTLGRVLGAAGRTNGSRRPWRRPRSGSPPAPTSSGSTTSRPTSVSRESAMRSSGRTGATRAKEAPAERPDRALEHAIHGPPRLLRPRAAGAAALWRRRRARARPPAGGHRRRP